MLRLLIVSCVWALSFPLIKGRLIGLDAGMIAFLRLSLSLLVFLPLLRRDGTELKQRLTLAGIGAVQFGLMYVLYIASYAYLPAHVIVLLTTTTPIFVTCFGDAIDRQFRPVFLASAALAVAGGMVIRYPDQPLSASLAGVVLVQGSNAAFAVGQVAYRRVLGANPGWRDSRVFGWLYLGAALVAGVFACRRGMPAFSSVTTIQWYVLLYLGLVASALGFFLWNGGARRVNEGALAVLNNLKIPLGVAASLLLLGEQTNYPRLAVGLGLIAFALYLNYRWKRAVPSCR